MLLEIVYLTLILNPILLQLSLLLSVGLDSGSLCTTDSHDRSLLTVGHLGHIRRALVLQDEYSVLSEIWALQKILNWSVKKNSVTI